MPKKSTNANLQDFNLFGNMLNGFAVCKPVLNKQGEPIDYIFLDINPGGEKILGWKKKNVIGQKVTKLIPGIEHDPAQWIKHFGQVALSGKDVRLEAYSQALKHWYSVYAYRPKKGIFAIIFEDVSAKKTSDVNLKKKVDDMERMQKLMVGREIKMIELKKQIKVLASELAKKSKK